MVIVRYFKTKNNNNQIIRLDNSFIKADKNSSEISSVEYKLLKVAVKIFIALESVESIKAEDWWQ